MLGIPSNLDQYLASERICAQKAGAMLRSGSLTEEQVTTTVYNMLTNVGFRENAQRLGQVFNRHDVGENFRRFVAQRL